MNLFQILDATCSTQMQTLIGAVKFILTLIRWAIPIVLIIMGSIDMFKAMASGDEKKAKEAQKTFIRRLIYAVVAFLIPFIISLVFDFIGSTFNNQELQDAAAEGNNFFVCWNNASSNSSSDGTCTCLYNDDEDVVKGVTREVCENNYEGHCSN